MARLSLATKELQDVKQSLTIQEQQSGGLTQQLEEKEGMIEAMKKKEEELQLSVQKLTANLPGKRQVIGARRILCDRIMEVISKNWSHLLTLHHEDSTVSILSKNVDRIKAEMGNQPEIAERVIDYLNGRSTSELQALNISDITGLIMEAKRVLSKLDLATVVQK